MREHPFYPSQKLKRILTRRFCWWATINFCWAKHEHNAIFRRLDLLNDDDSRRFIWNCLRGDKNSQIEMLSAKVENCSNCLWKFNKEVHKHCGNSTWVLGCEFYANQKQTKHKKLDVSLCCCCTDGKSGNSWVNSEASRAEMRANINNGRVWRQEGIIIQMCIYTLILSLLLFEHNWIKFEWWIITASSLTHR